MSEPGAATVEASTHIAADPAAVYALITDLPTLASLAEEADRMEWHKGDHVTPGAVFRGHNSNGGKEWTTTCTVTDAEPGRTFAFDVKSFVIPVAHWRYDITAFDGGCTVTERTWDKRPGWFKTIAGMAIGVRDRDAANAEHIKLTLQRLKAKAEAAG
ncbi:SRPBCC family protein [Mycolicibacterium celeriflavum]|uniref:SRPBCC family protein n=1 Tax=Mycolicibacterium celeriflavum TaxID=1249101 RepID=UPI003CF7C78D